LGTYSTCGIGKFWGRTPGSTCGTATEPRSDRAPSEAHTTPKRREQKRKHLFPCSDPDGYQAEPGPYSCRSRHDLHHACRTVRDLRSLLRTSPRTQPPPLPFASQPTPVTPFLQSQPPPPGPSLYLYISQSTAESQRRSVGCAD